MGEFNYVNKRYIYTMMMMMMMSSSFFFFFVKQRPYGDWMMVSIMDKCKWRGRFKKKNNLHMSYA
jgi:hypothetical protein